MCSKFFTLSHLARHATAGLRPVLLEGCHPCIRELFSYASPPRHATEDDLSSDEWHLYTQLYSVGSSSSLVTTEVFLRF